MRNLLLGLILLSNMGLCKTVLADDPGEVLARSVAAYTSLTPIERSGNLELDMAEQVQRMLVLTLRPQWGEIVGYKAALTSEAARKRFGIDQPVTGVMLENMFTSTGSTIQAATGVNLLLEADLLVRVANEAINDATSEQEILAALSQVVPFLEIPDTMFAAGVSINAADVIAINAGSRIGVMGAPVEISSLTNPREALGAIRFTLHGNKQLIAEGSSKALMGHPLAAALWLKNDLNRQDIKLKAGDLLSLGGMHRPVPAKGQGLVELNYFGLGEQPASIRIRVQ